MKKEIENLLFKTIHDEEERKMKTNEIPCMYGGDPDRNFFKCDDFDTLFEKAKAGDSAAAADLAAWFRLYDPENWSPDEAEYYCGDGYCLRAVYSAVDLSDDDDRPAPFEPTVERWKLVKVV